jgi:hypothetical protein
MEKYVCSDCLESADIDDRYLGATKNNEAGELHCHVCNSVYSETLTKVLDHARPASHLRKTRRKKHMTLNDLSANGTEFEEVKL